MEKWAFCIPYIIDRLQNFKKIHYFHYNFNTWISYQLKTPSISYNNLIIQCNILQLCTMHWASTNNP